MRAYPRLASTIFGVCLFATAANAQEAELPKVTNFYENDFNEKISDSIWPYSRWRAAADGKGYISFATWMPHCYLRGLPEHQFVRLRIRVLMFGSLEGSPIDGPTDYWTLSLKDGPLLLRTSFQNSQAGRGVADGFGQSFPDEIPAGLHAAETGAVGVDQHGLGGGDNSVYEIELAFPHQGKDLFLEFQEAFSEWKNEGWYLLGFEADVVSGAVPRTEAELDGLWKKLTGEDPMEASKAINEFIASGKKGVDYVKKQQRALIDKPQKDLEEKINKHIEALDSEKFAVRIESVAALKKVGPEALPHLEEKLNAKPSPEVRKTLVALIGAFKKHAGRPGSPVYKRRLIAARVARVLRISGENTHGMSITSSSMGYLEALVDGYAGGEISNFNEAPKHLLSDCREGGEGWVQYTYDEARTFDSAGVFWSGSLPDDVKGFKEPESWSLSYLEEGKWKPIEPKGEYTTSMGKWDKVEFAPVKTKAIKLTVKSKKKTDRTAILEFKLGEVKGKGDAKAPADAKAEPKAD